MSQLLVLFVVVPVLELMLLIEIGRRVGTLATLGLIVATGVLGAYLARRQGLGVLRIMREEMAQGRLPAGQIVDGVLILLAGAVLMTPGVLTDALGFFCLVPAGRKFAKGYLRRWLERAARRGDVIVSINLGSPNTTASMGNERDVTPGVQSPREADTEQSQIRDSSERGKT